MVIIIVVVVVGFFNLAINLPTPGGPQARRELSRQRLAGVSLRGRGRVKSEC